MSDTAKKASFGQVMKGLVGGLLKAGFLITVVVYIANTFILRNMGVSPKIIVSLVGIVIYLMRVLRSTTKANRHESPDLALKDSMGDLFSFGILLTVALIWSFLPNFAGTKIGYDFYLVNLFFFWGMFVLCAYEATLTISNSLYQMYRVQQIRTER